MPDLTFGSQSAATDADTFSITNTLGLGQSDKNIASLSTVVGRSNIAHGVHGVSGAGGGAAPQDPTNNGVGTGVWGESTSGYGVYGECSSIKAVGFLGGFDPIFGQHAGVYGESDEQGVCGVATANGTGVFGSGGAQGFGVRGECTNGPAAVKGQSFGTGLAGLFEGNMKVTGNHECGGTLNVAIDVVLGAQAQDCAEDFDVTGSDVEAGSVVVMNEQGVLQRCAREYDRKVAGVISGAGNLRPGIILGKEESGRLRMPVALVGKVYCKIDASYSPVEIGDLLTTSSTPGYAMKATDQARAFGAVIGKALASRRSGQGLIPILVALQ